jgi:hypothetical protein
MRLRTGEVVILHNDLQRCFALSAHQNMIGSYGQNITNIWHGNITKFFGQEKVGNTNDDWLFEADYRSGIVNVR